MRQFPSGKGVDSSAEIAVVDAKVVAVDAEVKEAERHLHNYERWIGPAAVPTATHLADPLGQPGGSPAGVLTSFRLTCGASKVWGTPVQIWGSGDCVFVLPVDHQGAFDLHAVKFTDVEDDKEEWIICVGAGANMAAAISAGTYLTQPFFIEKTNKNQSDIDLLLDKEVAGTAMWAMLLHVTNNNIKYVDCQFGVHGYPV